MKKNTKSKSKDVTTKILLILTLFCVVMVLVVVGQFLVVNKKVNKDEVADGTIINGVNVNGLTSTEASQKLSQVFNEKADNFSLVLTSKNNTWEITKKDFVVNSDIHTILDVAQTREKETDSYEKQKDLLSNLTLDGKSVNVAINYIFTGLDKKIDEIINQVEIAPINSVIQFDPNSKDMWNISDSVDGIRVDKAQLYQTINDEFLKTNKMRIELPLVTECAEITKEYNSNLTKLVSSFSTNVADSTGNRKSNVKLALSKFNGVMVSPGESVSFNKVTGPHSVDNGYKLATVIYNSQFVEGVGGGICQASTTLYNAILKANMTIDEVNKHTLPVKYVPLALDAMVSEYISDLRFTNTTDYPIFIKTYSDATSVTCQIYSHELPDNITYNTRSEVIKELPHSGDIIKRDVNKEYTDKVLFVGEYYRLSYPRVGYEANSYLQTYKDGKLINEELIRHEIYKPQNGIIIEGDAEPEENMNVLDSSVNFIDAQIDTGIIIPTSIDTIPNNLCP